jgi:hypothetical protein
LLFIESRTSVSHYRNGTEEYEEALNRLKNVNYTYANGEVEEEEARRMSVLSERLESIQETESDKGFDDILPSSGSNEDKTIMRKQTVMYAGSVISEDMTMKRKMTGASNNYFRSAHSGSVVSFMTAVEGHISENMTVFSDVHELDSDSEEEDEKVTVS